MFRILVAASLLTIGLPSSGSEPTVDALVEKNVAARGGAQAWQAVISLRLTGSMDVGQGMKVPYVLEQKRPDKMRLELVFDGKTAVQSYDGEAGWKLRPFLGRTTPEPMTEKELREAADTADLYGLLFDYAARGHQVELVGQEPVEGRDAYKLKVTLPEGSVRWVYLDAETVLEIKLEALRMLGGRERRVATFYHDWQETDGVLIAHRQEIRTEDVEGSHALTVESVRVNPRIEDARFAMPGTASGDRNQNEETSS